MVFVLKYKKGIFLFIFLISVMCGMGQENYTTRTFTTRDGLPHNQVNSIAQDSTGFLWFATWDGLARYDGYEFKNYYHRPGDAASIPYFSVGKVLVDKQNQIWIGSTIGKIVKYDPANDCFSHLNEFIRNEHNEIAVDKKGFVWKYGSLSLLEKYDFRKNEFTDILLVGPDGKEVKYGNDKTFRVQFDNHDNLWIYSDTYGEYMVFMESERSGDTIRLQRFTMLSEVQRRIALNREKPKLPILIIHSPFISKTNKIFMCSNIGLYLLDTTKNSFNEIKKDISFSDLTGEKTFIWSDFDNYSTTNIYNPAKGTLISTEGQSESCFLFAFEDDQGNIWITKSKLTGEGDGVTEVIPTAAIFKHYLLDEENNQNASAFFSVLKDHQGNIWAAARNRNYIIKIDHGKPPEKVNILNNRISDRVWHPRSLLEDTSGIWIGYFRTALMYYEFSTGRFIRKYWLSAKEKETTPDGGFQDLIEVDNGLVGNLADQLFYYDISKNKLTLVTDYRTDSEPHTIFKVRRTSDKGFLLCLNFGRVKHIDQNYRELNSWTVGQGIFNVEDICEGNNHDLWIALLGGGLSHLDVTSGQEEIFTTADGLSNNTCYAILKDRSGNLWISTNQGISRFNPETKQFRTFGESDGLKIEEFNSDAAYLAPDGEMFFGGMGGIVSFYPDSLNEMEIKTPPVRLVITDFKVSGVTRHFKKAVYDLDTVSLNKGDNNFQVTFACLDFQNADKIRYRYRLSGENWIETDWHHRFVNYTNLSPGDYQLEIEATNKIGDWVSKEFLLVSIPAYFYQTVWFIILLLLLLASLITYLVYTYIHRIRMKARQQQEELKLESLRGQMNPHFIFNSLNSINYFISQNDRLSANRYIADFSRLIRTILGNLSSDYVPFTKELESLSDYLQLEHLRFSDKFDYILEVPEGMGTSDMLVFPGMVQPFIENAIWHGIRGLEGRKGMIRIVFSLKAGGQLECAVEDDGIGRRLSELRKSNLPGKTSRGIGIVLERLRIINNLRNSSFRVVIEDLYPDREETGTRVIIDIPTKKV